MRHPEERCWVIVGMGNPGPEYENTRHNLGFKVVQALTERLKLHWKKEDRFQSLVCKTKVANDEIHLLLPMTFINRTGGAVRKYLDYYKLTPSQVVVVVDDAALPFGHLRLRGVGSSGGHNGLKDIQTQLGTTHYARLRMGIGSVKIGLAEYVLSPFSNEERRILDTFIHQGVETLFRLFETSLTRVMNEVNKKETP